jgi:hypothetical protein
MKTKTQIKRLNYISGMLNKYAHCWSKDNGKDPSDRMFDWVDEYNDYRFSLDRTKNAVWEAYCLQYGRSFSHDAYDCMA